MNYNTVKKLHGIALLLEAVALLIVLLMTMGQKAVKPLALTESDLCDIFTIPVGTLISVIPILILFAISFFLMKKSNGNNSKTHVIACIIIAITFHVLTPYINSLVFQVFATLQGVNYFASYNALEYVISNAVSPFETVSFTLFCLSLGGYYGMEGKKEQ